MNIGDVVKKQQSIATLDDDIKSRQAILLEIEEKVKVANDLIEEEKREEAARVERRIALREGEKAFERRVDDFERCVKSFELKAAKVEQDFEHLSAKDRDLRKKADVLRAREEQLALREKDISTQEKDLADAAALLKQAEEAHAKEEKYFTENLAKTMSVVEYKNKCVDEEKVKVAELIKQNKDNIARVNEELRTAERLTSDARSKMSEAVRYEKAVNDRENALLNREKLLTDKTAQLIADKNNLLKKEAKLKTFAVKEKISWAEVNSLEEI